MRADGYTAPQNVRCPCGALIPWEVVRACAQATTEPLDPTKFLCGRCAPGVTADRLAGKTVRVIPTVERLDG